jgi:alanine racemase
MVDFLKRSWAVVNLDRVAWNYRRIRELLQPRCLIMGVV